MSITMLCFNRVNTSKTLLKESVLLEDKLPAEGYVLSGEKRENVVINLPIKDRSLLAELVRKFGWACM